MVIQHSPLHEELLVTRAVVHNHTLLVLVESVPLTAKMNPNFVMWKSTHDVIHDQESRIGEERALVFICLDVIARPIEDNGKNRDFF